MFIDNWAHKYVREEEQGLRLSQESATVAEGDEINSPSLHWDKNTWNRPGIPAVLLRAPLVPGGWEKRKRSSRKVTLDGE